MVDKALFFSSSLTSQQKPYNYRLSQARVVVEIAFGKLKVMWQRLAKQIDMHHMSLQPVVFYTMFVKYTMTPFTSGCKKCLDQLDCLASTSTLLCQIGGEHI